MNTDFNPFEVSSQVGRRSPLTTRNRLWWISALSGAELFSHFLVFRWVTPPPNTWDMGGVAASVQFLVFLWGCITASLICGIVYRIDAARILLAGVSMITAIGAFAFIAPKIALGAIDTKLIYPAIYCGFSSVVAVCLLAARSLTEINPHAGNRS